jgi:hypothetical protein
MFLSCSIWSTSARRRACRSSPLNRAFTYAVTMSPATVGPMTRPPSVITLQASCSTIWWAV